MLKGLFMSITDIITDIIIENIFFIILVFIMGILVYLLFVRFKKILNKIADKYEIRSLTMIFIFIDLYVIFHLCIVIIINLYVRH